MNSSDNNEYPKYSFEYQFDCETPFNEDAVESTKVNNRRHSNKRRENLILIISQVIFLIIVGVIAFVLTR